MADKKEQQSSSSGKKPEASASSFGEKLNAFVSNPKPEGTAPSTWTPVRDSLVDMVHQLTKPKK